MTPIAIDTSLLVGLLDERDIWHSRSLQVIHGLAERQLDVVVFDCVLAETISTLSKRLEEKRRSNELAQTLMLLRREYPDSRITWLYPQSRAMYDEILQLVIHTGGALNFNDALIALACLERKIPLIASFDSDFDQVEWLTRISSSDIPERS